jgi:hypothetical protein
MLKHRYARVFPYYHFPPNDAQLAQLLQKCVNDMPTPRRLLELCVSGGAP